METNSYDFYDNIGHKFVQITRSGVVATSEDGVTWVHSLKEDQERCSYHFYDRDSKRYVRIEGSNVTISPDGMTWTELFKEKQKENKGNTEYFDSIVEYRIKKIREVLTSKAKEYTYNNDRFHNFNQAAAINDTTPEKALWGMLLKHLVSIQDMVNSTPKKPFKEFIDEKIGDTINYLILLEGLLKEK